MSLSALFHFHGNLIDFLPKHKKAQPVTFTFTGNPSVKDAFEAIGVPHPEVDVVVVNGQPAMYTKALKANDVIQLYPYQPQQNGKHPYSFFHINPFTHSFVLDVHLGKLARALRLRGIDAAYENNYTDNELAAIQQTENRVLLTRDVGLLKHKIVKHGYWLRSQHTVEQFTEVVNRFGLYRSFQPFKRCLLCNGALMPVTKDEVLPHLPPATRLVYNEFYQCRQCQKVYWKGSHYQHMQETVKKMYNL